VTPTAPLMVNNDRIIGQQRPDAHGAPRRMRRGRRTYGNVSRRVDRLGLVIDAGVEGLYGRTLAYEQIIAGIISLTTRTGAGDGAMTVHFPPVIPRWLLERTDYLKSFPDTDRVGPHFQGRRTSCTRGLLTLVEEGRDWVEVLEPADVVLRPAACHPVYPLCTDGPLPADGRRFEVQDVLPATSRARTRPG